jgi:hypothetical protein
VDARDRLAGIERGGLGVSVLDAAPVANAGLDRNVKAGALVQLDGSGSYDPDGDRLSYQWSLVSAPPGSTLGEAAVMGLDTPTPRFRSEVRRDKVAFVFLVDTARSTCTTPSSVSPRVPR